MIILPKMARKVKVAYILPQKCQLIFKCVDYQHCTTFKNIKALLNTLNTLHTFPSFSAYICAKIHLIGSKFILIPPLLDFPSDRRENSVQVVRSTPSREWFDIKVWTPPRLGVDLFRRWIIYSLATALTSKQVSTNLESNKQKSKQKRKRRTLENIKKLNEMGGQFF